MEKAQLLPETLAKEEKNGGNTLFPFFLPSNLLQGLPLGEPGWKLAGTGAWKMEATGLLFGRQSRSRDGAKSVLRTMRWTQC